MSIFSRIKAPEQKPRELDPVADIMEFVEHTETMPMGGPAARLDKVIGGGWSVELSDGQYISIDRLAACWLHNNRKNGIQQAGLNTY